MYIDVDLELYKKIQNSQINYLLTVPCAMLKKLLIYLDEIDQIPHLSVTREEEGVGIAAGLYMGGVFPAILMQNSGLGNSINAIKSLLFLYKIPVVFIMSHRGGAQETIEAQIPMGEITFDLLECLDMNCFVLDETRKLELINEFVKNTFVSKKPSAIVLEKSLWR